MVSGGSYGGLATPTPQPQMRRHKKRQMLDPSLYRTTDADGDPVTVLAGAQTTIYDDDGDPSTTLFMSFSTVQSTRSFRRACMYLTEDVAN